MFVCITFLWFTDYNQEAEVRPVFRPVGGLMFPRTPRIAKLRSAVDPSSLTPSHH